MKAKHLLIFILAGCLGFVSCSEKFDTESVKIILLHHSTGGVIWSGDLSQVDQETVNENPKIRDHIPLLFAQYNKVKAEKYVIRERSYPKAAPYGWNNYPYDYYNIWVKNGGDKPYMKEPTLEILANQYDVIIFKHCFPVSDIQDDGEDIDINSDKKTLGNYKLQYKALREKMLDFPDTKFLLWTGAMQVKAATTEEEANRTRDFFDWVINEWDLPNDNIFIWDLYQLQTEGGLYFKDEYAVSRHDSHPNKSFAGNAANLLFNRIIDVIENNGKDTRLTGEKL